MNPYSEQDLKTIKRYAGTITTARLAAKIGRTRAGLAQYANARGIELKQVGQHHYNAKLDDKSVDDILKLHDEGVSTGEIHKKYNNIKIGSIYDLIDCRTWRHK